MKQYLVIPLLFAYALAISGLTIHTHYCGKRLIAVNFSLQNDDPCNKGCNKKPMKCCKDKVVTLKVNTEQKNVAAFKVKTPVLLTTVVLYPSATNISLISSEYAFNHFSNAPPGLWQQIPLYKLFSSLAYYG